MSGTMKSLAHSRWECKDHVVFIPKYRRKAIYGELRKLLGEIFHDLARQKECRIIEGHLLADHVQGRFQLVAVGARNVQQGFGGYGRA